MLLAMLDHGLDVSGLTVDAWTANPKPYKA